MFSLLHAAQNKEGKQIHVFYFNWKKKYKNNNNKKTFQEEPKEISNVLV